MRGISEHYERKPSPKRRGVYVQVVDGVEFKVIAIREGRFGRKYIEVAARQVVGNVSGWQTEHLAVGDSMSLSFSYEPEAK